MQRVLVIDSNKTAQMPCSARRARELLSTNKASVFRLRPFTIILKHVTSGVRQDIELKIDPGSRISGIALVATYHRGQEVLLGINLEHRGRIIKSRLAKRRAIRSSRRNRKTRYRKPRFDNRVRSKGWLPPSLISRVYNIVSLCSKLQRLVPVSSMHIEQVAFDMQKLANPEISTVAYQQGTLYGFELREYLLQKFQHSCAYCSKQNIPLEIDHVAAKSKGGSDRVDNLVISCRDCNVEKGNQDIEVFLQDKPQILSKVKRQQKAPLHDAAAVNAMRNKIVAELELLEIPLATSTGGRTKYNRVKQGYPKEHWIDAACVGISGEAVSIMPNMQILTIKAQGHGTRQMCRVDRYGFPRTRAKAGRLVSGFKTGDLVKAVVTKGKKVGTYVGRVAVRTSGSFNITTMDSTIQGINYKYCKTLQRADGYNYYLGGGISSPA